MSTEPKVIDDMNDREFRALLDWFMSSDPWPVDGGDSHELMTNWLDRAAKSRGYTGWVEAFHRSPGRPDPIGDKLRSLPVIGVINVDNPRDPRHKEWKL
jgi:hypothetical protein